MIAWIASNWFNLGQTLALVVTLGITVSALRGSRNASQASNLLSITAYNREIWGQLVSNPGLRSVLRTDLQGAEPRLDEERFAIQVIQHTITNYEILTMGGIPMQERLRADVRDTLSLPIFRATWQRIKVYQNPDVVKFIDDCISGLDLDQPVGRQSRFANARSRRRNKGGSPPSPDAGDTEERSLSRRLDYDQST